MDLEQIVAHIITAEDCSVEDMLAEFDAFHDASKQSVRNGIPKTTTDKDPSAASNSTPAKRATKVKSSPQYTTKSFRVFGSIFIRIDKICLVINHHREEFRWNKRSKSWKNEKCGAVEMGCGFDRPGPSLHVSIRPHGFGLPVLLGWDLENKYFKGTTLEDDKLIVDWRELKDMVCDPWERQYEGYYCRSTT